MPSDKIEFSSTTPAAQDGYDNAQWNTTGITTDVDGQTTQTASVSIPRSTSDLYGTIRLSGNANQVLAGDGSWKTVRASVDLLTNGIDSLIFAAGDVILIEGVQ